MTSRNSNVRRFLRSCALALAVLAALHASPAGALSGDATLGSNAPSVAIINPSDGEVLAPKPATANIRVQARIYSPTAGGAITAVNLYGGTTGTTLLGAMTWQAYYGGTSSYSGVWELKVALAAGSTHMLIVQATNNNTVGTVKTVSSTPVNVTVGSNRGDGNLIVRDNSSALCADCHNLPLHSSESTKNTYGSWAVSCRECHTPHKTTNIYLVKTSITPPPITGNTTPKSVVFWTNSNYVANSLASPSGPPPNGPCQVCHTRTKYYRSDGSLVSHNQGTACNGCHSHAKGFGAAESTGGVACGTCHSAIYNAMNGTTAKNFKHTLPTSGGDAVADTGFNWTTATTLSGVALASRSCISMCHGDHPHDMPSASITTHEYNAYLDATTSATRSGATGTQSLTNRDNTDFDSAATNGGMCASCHQKPVVTGGITIAKATYAASAHNYTSFGTYGQWQYTQHDGGIFLRNCTKCHADRNDARPNTTTIPFGAVHYSDYDSLLAGVKNPATTQGTLDTAKRATFVCYNCHGSATIGTNLSGKDVATQADKANVAGQSGHPTDKDAVHDTVTEMTSTAFPNTGLTGANRHVNCVDCHDTHKAGNTLRNYAAVANATRNLIPAGSPLVGASGIQYGTVATGKSYPALPGAGLWPASTSANYGASLVASATYEYEVCFKCHTAYAFGGTSAVTTQNGPSGLAETDLGMEFSPNMKSGHPVVQPLNSYTGSATPKALTTAQLTATWAAVGTQTMTCTDCHYGDAASPAVQGPHGSAVTFILRGPNTRWPTNASNALYNLGSNPTNNTHLAGLFCLNCHPLFTGTSNTQASWQNNTVHYNHSGPQVASVECVRCHILIPHGGKMSRLIGDREAMPARYAYQGTLTNMYISSFTKASTPGGYGTGNCNASAVSACSTHNTTTQTDNW